MLFASVTRTSETHMFLFVMTELDVLQSISASSSAVQLTCTAAAATFSGV